MGFVMKGFSQSANSYFGHWLAKYLANENATIQSQMLQQNAKLPERAMERERENSRMLYVWNMYQKLPTYVTSQKYSKCS